MGLPIYNWGTPCKFVNFAGRQAEMLIRKVGAVLRSEGDYAMALVFGFQSIG